MQNAPGTGELEETVQSTPYTPAQKPPQQSFVPAYDSPAHKLINKGAESLTDVEILSLFMNENVELARRTLLFNLQSLRELFRARPDEFEVLGVSQQSYVQLQAVLELSRRHLQEKTKYGDILEDPETVKKLLMSRLRECRSELFCVLYLNTRHQLITIENLFQGTIDSANVYPRGVLRRCINYNAEAVILSNNHPSGVAEPSQSDQRITQRLQEVLQLIDVRVLDHFIVGETVTSFAERGLI